MGGGPALLMSRGGLISKVYYTLVIRIWDSSSPPYFLVSSPVTLITLFILHLREVMRIK